MAWWAFLALQGKNLNFSVALGLLAPNQRGPAYGPCEPCPLLLETQVCSVLLKMLIHLVPSHDPFSTY